MATKTPKKKTIVETTDPAELDRSMQALLNMAKPGSISLGNVKSNETTENQGIAAISNANIGGESDVSSESSQNQDIAEPELILGEANVVNEEKGKVEHQSKVEGKNVEDTQEIKSTDRPNEELTNSTVTNQLDTPSDSVESSGSLPLKAKENPKNSKTTKAARKNTNTIPDIEDFTKNLFVKHESSYHTQIWVSDSNYSKIKALIQMLNHLELEGTDGASVRGVLNNIVSQYFTDNAEEFRKIEKAYMQKSKQSIF